MTMPTPSDLDRLDDRTVLAILGDLTEELQQRVPDEADAIRSEDEARQALALLLEESGERAGPVDPAAIVPEDGDNARLARRLLGHLMDDETAGASARRLVEHPPRDDQMSVELAIAGAIVLGTLITWLQTKFKLRVARKDGRTDFTLDIEKQAADSSLVQDTVQSVAQLLLGP
jgi:hypothetical protein